MLKGSVDFLGLNSYTGIYARQGTVPPPGAGSPYTDQRVITSGEAVTRSFRALIIHSFPQRAMICNSSEFHTRFKVNAVTMVWTCV